MPVAPCKDCPRRHYLCHSECPDYIAYQKARDELSEIIRKSKQLENDLFGVSNRKDT